MRWSRPSRSRYCLRCAMGSALGVERNVCILKPAAPSSTTSPRRRLYKTMEQTIGGKLKPVYLFTP